MFSSIKIKLSLAIMVLTTSLSGIEAQELDKKTITEIIGHIPGLITEHYVIKEKGIEIAERFQSEISSGKYHSISNPDTLASVLTSDLRRISKDGHMYVKHLTKKSKGNTDWAAEERANEIALNYGFTEIQVLENNIGYLKIVEFMHPKRSMQTAVAAMKFVENTDALIIDIRNNGGGYPGIMEYIMDHYFDGAPTHLATTYFSNPNAVPYANHTSDVIYGTLRVGTPLYILINEKTGSAAEFFPYTLQAFGKAIIVGETSSGHANNNEYFRLNEDFNLSISTAMPINVLTKTNWEITGVIPDIKVKSEKAKEKALEVIKNKMK